MTLQDHGDDSWGEVLEKSNYSEGRTLIVDDSNNAVVLRISDSFRISLGAVLITAVIIRLALFSAIICFRNRPSLQLTQPIVLGILVLSGATAIGGCYLILPINDSHCLLREPFIFVSLTIAGNTLVGRIWRISLLMTPVLQVGRKEQTAGSRLKGALMENLTRLADSGDVIKRFFFRETRLRENTTLRRKIPLMRLLWLSFVLTIPQLVLQVCNLVLPSMRSHYDLYEINDSLQRECCRNDVGSWSTWVGIVLTLVPYTVTSYISVKSDHLPKVFDDGQAFMRSFRVFCLILATAGPAYALAESPNARTYLECCLVFAVAMPPCWFVVHSKIWDVLVSESRENVTRLDIGKLLVKSGRADMELVTRLTKKAPDENEKSAKLALTIGKMFEDMGKVKQSIELFDQALSLWECDPCRASKEKTGGFTVDEINSFTTTDLDYIIQLLIAKGRVNGTFNSAMNTGQKDAARSWLDALEIYEAAPASVEIHDRSIVFPIFSGLFVFLKGGKIQQDKDCNFEQNLVHKFVRETKLHGDPVHYSRALAMQCEVKARLGKYRAALESFELLKTIYDPENHSEGVSNAYGTDRSAQAFSQSALWLFQLGREEEAVQSCEDVLRCLLPLMDPKNVLNTCELLLPVIWVLKPRGQSKRMRDLFQEHVVNNFHRHFGKDGVTPCLPIFKPMLMLLDMCHDPQGFPDFHDMVEWLVDNKNGIPPDFLDSVYTKLCWSPMSMVAELCLRVAQRLDESNGAFDDIKMLVEKGLTLAQKADRKMKDEEGEVVLRIAYVLHEPVIAGLQSMADPLGIKIQYHGVALDESTTENTAISPHLPGSYDRRHASTSSGRSTSQGTPGGSLSRQSPMSPTDTTDLDTSSRPPSEFFASQIPVSVLESTTD